MTAEAVPIEAQIRARVTAGDVEAATTLAITHYGPELLGYLHAVARDADLAGEAFAVACESVWKALPGFRWESSLRTWAYAVARRALWQLAQAPARRRAYNLPASMLDSIADVQRTATAPYQRTELKEAFRALRASLDPFDHELLILRLDRGMSWKDIARATADDDDAPNLDQRAAALRKRFERVKTELRDLAVARGLLAD